MDFETAIAEGTLDLFSPIVAELSDADKSSLLALQRIARDQLSYVYLEIGSHLGGSLQPHLRDPKCTLMYSIDPRPAVQNDSRGVRFGYRDNSTQRMLDGLRPLVADRLGKIRTFECDASQVHFGDEPTADLIFIDGEHTDAAAYSDALSALRFAAPNALIVFHDAPIVYEGIARFVEQLKSERTFVGFGLPDNLFVIALDDAGDRFANSPWLTMSGAAYLQALRVNSGYRRLRTTPVVRIAFRLIYGIGAERFVKRFEYGGSRQ